MRFELCPFFVHPKYESFHEYMLNVFYLILVEKLFSFSFI